MVEYLLGQMQHIACHHNIALFVLLSRVLDIDFSFKALITDADCCDISAGQLLAHTSLQCVNVTGESVSTMVMERELLYTARPQQE